MKAVRIWAMPKKIGEKNLVVEADKARGTKPKLFDSKSASFVKGVPNLLTSF